MKRKFIAKPGKGIVASKIIAQTNDSDVLSNGQSLIAFLKSKGIDTTKHKYKLVAERYERYSSGDKYSRTFTCPGDYLAYFSMRLHTGPTIDELLDYFGDSEDFVDFVDSNPSTDAIADHAASCWYGDGDDYIIELANLDTGDVLYDGQYEEYMDEYEEEDLW